MVAFSLHFQAQNQKVCDNLFESICKERDSQKSGYYDLPFAQEAMNEASCFVNDNKAFLHTLSHLVIIGIGGSSLGLKAIDSMLEHLPHRNTLKLLFLEHTDPINITKITQGIKRENTLFIVISKSGTTIETSSLLKFVLAEYNLLQDAQSKQHLLVITDKDSPLEHWAQKENLTYFVIPPNVGGRFSVLSMVGILPLSILGFDMRSLLRGAADITQRFFERKEEHILHKALTYAAHKKQVSMNVLFSYSSLFTHFNAWYVQLWGESLGKINAMGERVGLTPIGLIGSIDQHSFLQLIVQGVRDKSVTFLSLNPVHSAQPSIPNIEIPFLESTNFVNMQSFATLLNNQRIATMQTIENEGILTDCIEVMSLCEQSVGTLIAYFEILTSCMGQLFEINTYDQPGVEFGKARLKKLFKA
ncbi:glucose-6-phosphate isomerase [Helicobacter sp. MIT 21-1697]|uniref:glucose-6-phosphate isomerase n=1 Tax=Helicobacter sp. MIT 21-1697 TaxID=2993733 RepID=UPI00224AAA52|nr:glucose-6-phosphate isomerase [Helicobacter sp. MIT 21-1697]MCX2716364.1 glucose-6-phosphate isomerase [Helicobacter sp. MIT 21-1697]